MMDLKPTVLVGKLKSLLLLLTARKIHNISRLILCVSGFHTMCSVRNTGCKHAVTLFVYKEVP